MRALGAVWREVKWEDVAWERAACVGRTDLDFFPNQESFAKAMREIRAVCGACAIRNDCLRYATGQGERLGGIWAGTSEKQRRRQRAGLR